MIELVLHTDVSHPLGTAADVSESALGHVRLEINDLSPSGAQPLHDSQQRIHAVVNGEIYEYDRLRAEMIEKLDYRFQGRSDCELVLALYIYYGPSFVSHLRGEFAVCLYDSDREIFLAVRDRYGIKPLFWTVVDGELFVAAEMKALVPLGWKPEWNVKGIVDGGFQIGAETIFKNVQKLTKELRSEDEMIEGVRSRLLDAIQVRLRADVKVGVALSGGIDSSVVAGMVNHLIREGEQVGGDAITEKLSCFSVAFDAESGFDESATASRTADFLGVKLYKKHMDEQALAERFEDATWMNEQPNPDLNFVGLFALSELVREKGFRVIINGQGADEIFAGYPLFLPDFLREPDHAFPPPHPRISDQTRKRLVRDAEARFPPSPSPSPSTTTTTTAHLLTSTSAPTQMASAYPLLPIHPSLSPHNSPNPTTLYAEAIAPSVHAKMTKEWHPLNTACYLFCKAHLENLLLSCLGDRGEMAHGVEGRTPFLDHRLAEFANGLPVGMKIRARAGGRRGEMGGDGDGQVVGQEGGVKVDGDDDDDDDSNEIDFVEKYALREAARPFVTDEIYNKRKHPYSAPLRYGIGGPLHRLMTRLVTEENVKALGFLDWRPGMLKGETLARLVDGAFEGEKEEGGFRLVICLAQWVVLGRRFAVRRAG